MSPKSDTSVSFRDWLAIICLSIASFIIVTTELAPIGLLSQIGDDLNKPPSQIGLAVTLYAWIAAIAALVSVTALSHLPRRGLLMVLMIILAASAAVTAISSNYSELMIARVIGSIAHGAFWAMIGTLGAQIVRPEKIGMATSIIFGGVSAASVIGVPLSNFIGVNAGWRTTFWCIAIAAILVGLTIRFSVPKIQGAGGIKFSKLISLAQDKTYVRIFISTFLAITAHFMAYTYIEPYLKDELDISVNLIAVLLLCFGLAGLAANFVTATIIDRYLKGVLVTSLVVGCLSVFLISYVGKAFGTAVVLALLIAWGASVSAIFVSLQTWILKSAGEDALPVSSVYVALFNASIGLGAMLGSVVLPLIGIQQIYVLASVFFVVALISVVTLRDPKYAYS
ncbi:MFS transporter [Sessilibacter sp. MAH1]